MQKKLTRKQKIQAAAGRKPQQALNSDKLKTSGLGVYVLLFLFAILLYGNTLTNGYVLDDFSVIKENNLVNQGTRHLAELFQTSYRAGYLGVNDGLYRPLSLVMFALEWQFAPDSPALGHFVNILLYALCLIVLYRLLKQIRFSNNETVVLIAVTLFACHPIHTEVVANIKSRDELLCFLFSFLTIHEAVKYIQLPSVKPLIKSIMCFFLACLSKESAVLVFPLFFLIYFFYFRDKRSETLKMTLWLFLPLSVFFLIRYKVLGSVAGIQGVSYLDNPVGTQKDLAIKAYGIIFILAVYLKLLVWPYPLIFDYSYNSFPVENFGGLTIGMVLIPVVMLIAGVVVFFRRQPALSFSLLFILVGLSLYSHIFFTIGAAMAERFVFMASTGICLFVAALFERYLKPDNQPLKWLTSFKLPAVFLLVVMLTFTSLTIGRNRDWKDNYTLYAHDISLNERSAKIPYYLGLEIIKNQSMLEKDSLKKFESIREGIQQVKKALKNAPDYADAWSEIGVGYYKMHQLDSSARYFSKALELNPNNSVAISNLGSYYFNRGDYRNALEMYQRSLKIDPRFTDALVNTGSCYGMLKEYDQAIYWFKKAMETDPGNQRALQFLIMTYETTGDKVNADYYRKMRQ